MEIFSPPSFPPLLFLIYLYVFFCFAAKAPPPPPMKGGPPGPPGPPLPPGMGAKMGAKSLGPKSNLRGVFWESLSRVEGTIWSAEAKVSGHKGHFWVYLMLLLCFGISF